MRRVSVSCLLIIALIVASVAGVAQSNEYYGGYDDGRAAASEDVNGFAQFAGGFFLGLIYVVIAAVADGQSPEYARTQAIRSRSEDYQRGYREGYEEEWQRIRTNNALFGVGTLAAVYVVAYVVILSSIPYYY